MKFRELLVYLQNVEYTSPKLLDDDATIQLPDGSTEELTCVDWSYEKPQEEDHLVLLSL